MADEQNCQGCKQTDNKQKNLNVAEDITNLNKKNKDILKRDKNC